MQMLFSSAGAIDFLRKGTVCRARPKESQDASPANRARQRFTGACRPMGRKNVCRKANKTRQAAQTGDKPVAVRVSSRACLHPVCLPKKMQPSRCRCGALAPRFSPYSTAIKLEGATHGTRKTRYKTP